MRPESALHRFLCDALPNLPPGARLNVLAPRESAKTSWSTLAFPLRQALHGLVRYILIVGDTTKTSCKFLKNIRRQLDGNADLVFNYPASAGRGRKWSDDTLELRNGVLIEATSTNGKIRGSLHGEQRPDLVIIDDCQNKDHIVSPLMRERTWEWLMKDVLNVGSPETVYINLGTALHREGVSCKLQTTPGWRSRLFRSIEQWPVRMDLWVEWQRIYCDYDLVDAEREAAALAFYQANREAMDA